MPITVRRRSRVSYHQQVRGWGRGAMLWSLTFLSVGDLTAVPGVANRTYAVTPGACERLGHFLHKVVQTLSKN